MKVSSFTQAAIARKAADIMEAVVQAHRELLNEENAWRVFDYAGSEPLRKLDLEWSLALWAFREAKRRVRESGSRH